ncbi:MAG: Maf family protein [Kofleriaceae bacterium]|nr:Maf family protein [Kofleriaceae bacterium]
MPTSPPTSPPASGGGARAGAYAVQGIAAALVRAIRGSVTNVIGLPLAEVVELLRATGAAEVAFHRGRPA